MTPDPVAQFVDQVKATIAAHDLLPRFRSRRHPPEPVIVATSGGPDSVALVVVLDELARDRWLGVRPVVAHLHHGLRGPTADADQVFVEKLAAERGLEFTAARADVRAEAEARGLGLEEAGRQSRRAFLAQAARQCGARRVALGHTADDRAETVLFHILRGTGIEGLAALGPRAPLLAAEGIDIVRPLIDTPRHVVTTYLMAKGCSWREDETNSSDAYTRNRVRNDVLPLVREKVNPKADDALVRLSEQAAAAGEVLADALEAVWRQIVREVPAGASARSRDRQAAQTQPVPQTAIALVIDADDFAPLRPWMRGAILRRAVERLGGGLKHMSADRTAEVLKALLAKTVAGPVALPGGLVAERRRRVIRIGTRE